MKQEEHLKLIRAWCVNALENIASKRTPGEWRVEDFGNYEEYEIRPRLFIAEPAKSGGMTLGDAAFIATCAGAAEAGWKATIVAIDGLTATCDLFVNPSGAIPDACVAIDAILAAWPLSLLQHQSP